MGIKHSFTKNIIIRFGIPRIKRMIMKQKSLFEKSGILHPTSDSPPRFEIPLEMLQLFQDRDDIKMKHTFPIRRLLSIMKNIHLSVNSIKSIRSQFRRSSGVFRATSRLLTKSRSKLIGIHEITTRSHLSTIRSSL